MSDRPPFNAPCPHSLTCPFCAAPTIDQVALEVGDAHNNPSLTDLLRLYLPTLSAAGFDIVRRADQ